MGATIFCRKFCHRDAISERPNILRHRSSVQIMANTNEPTATNARVTFCRKVIMSCCVALHFCFGITQGGWQSIYIPREGLVSFWTGYSAKSTRISSSLFKPSIHISPRVFMSLHLLLDRMYRDLHAQENGTVKKRSETITVSDENHLWETHIHSLYWLPTCSFICRVLLQWPKFCSSRWWITPPAEDITARL